MAAEDDLLAAKTLMNDSRLTNVAAFLCQQCLEKCFKAMIEELEKGPIKSHDLFRLQKAANIELSENELNIMEIINEVYIDARYPGDLGLLPQGKPLISEIESFIQFCTTIFSRIKKHIQ
ncbi:MAG TPA: HEPN domain-containing protein [Prolixibacteraceae bacterium]|nr:HEPN domain-containing protein [Prolixibacteraceae bacterium]